MESLLTSFYLKNVPERSIVTRPKNECLQNSPECIIAAKIIFAVKNQSAL